MTNHCGYCGKGPFPTEGGLNKHIGQSKDCHEKNRLAFKSYTSTVWKYAPNTDNHSSSPAPSPPPDEMDLEQDLLTVERNFNLNCMTGMLDLPDPQTEHTRHPLPEAQLETHSQRYFEKYPSERKAGGAWGKDQPLFVRIQREQQEIGTSKWGPFKDQDKWELAEWLVKNVGQKQTDKFLKLTIVSTLVVMQPAVILPKRNRRKIACNHLMITIGTS